MLINSTAFSESYQQDSSNPPRTYPTTNQITPRYIFNPVIASFDSFIITPQQVKVGQNINFQLKLVGRDNLEVDIFYEEELLTRLANEGQGLYSGNYLFPVAPPGSYTDFRAIASNDEGEIELFTVTLPGVQVIPTPPLSVLLTPTEVTIGDSLVFRADIIGFDVTSVETFYLANDTRIPLANLTKQTDNSVDTQVFQGEFLIPSGVSAGQYDQFFAEATDVNDEKLQTPFNQVVTLSTDCATVNITVLASSGEALSGVIIAIAGKTAITDALGHATITQLPDSTEQTLLINAPDFLSPEPKLIPLSCLAELDEIVILEPTINNCVQLEVSVIDDSKLALPIPGASISVASQTAITDAEGKATFMQITEGLQTIDVSADTFSSAVLENVDLSCDAINSETIILSSNECATVNITVLASSGEALSGVIIAIAGKTAITDALGHATITQLPDSTEQTLLINAPDFLSPEPKLIPLSCLAELDEIVILEPTINNCVQLEVSVIDDSKLALPIPGASISVASQTAITDAEGKATFMQITEGLQTIDVSADTFSSAVLENVDLSCDAINSETIILSSNECATAQVRVVNDSGDGIPGAEVSMVSITEFTETGFTDINGFASLNNILEGTYTVTATASTFGNSIGGDPQVELTCNNENLIPNIILDICAKVDVIVSGSDETRLPGAEVNINDFSATTGREGIASFTQLNPGIHAYEVSRPGSVIISDAFSLAECRTDTEAVFPLNVILDTNCATANVTVIDIFKSAIPNAAVSIAGITRNTNSEGLATLRNILEGIHPVSATASGFGNPIGSIPPAVLACSNEETLPDITLDICQEINVHVFWTPSVARGDPLPLANTVVTIFAPNTPINELTDQDGIATFRKLNPGSYKYQVISTNFTPSEIQGTINIENCRTSPDFIFPQTEVEFQLIR